jgi:hypothetical protein
MDRPLSSMEHLCLSASRRAWALPASWRIAVVLLAAALSCRAEQRDDSSTWSFLPSPDTFSAASQLDLRGLNERVAGEKGFVRIDANGDFVRGDGKPIRFWAVNSDVGRIPFALKPLGPRTAPDLARHARFLAKRGVNMVRQMRQLSPALSSHPNAAITDINEAERDAIWRMVAAMRKEGIYTTLSPYWSAPMKFSPAWNIAGGADQSAFGLLFFDEQLQAAYKAWLRKLLVEPNPYTGIPLAHDPSVALIQIQNEDSLLFWTVSQIRGAQRAALEARYSRFLAGKYGTLAKAVAAWKGAAASQDAPDTGRLALLEPWELTQPGTGGKAVRTSDQTEFYARTMHEFNRMIVEYLRRDLGVEPLVNAGNWKTASSVRLNDAERWSYTAAQVDAVNVYTTGIHRGPYTGWAIVNGDKFTSESVLLHPQSLPINLKQTAGRPMLVTEGTWVMPSGFAAEGPFLIAAYASLTGVDGYYWFNTSDEGWSQPQSANGYLPSQAKWQFATPDLLGTFPAAALAYRLGYLSRGAPVIVENRPLQDLWDRRPPILSETPSFDPNRDAGDMAPASIVNKGNVPAAAFLVGPVQVAFGADPARSTIGSFTGLIEPAVVRSNTGQILFNQALGYCTIDAPMVQGVAAHFSNAPVHQLSDVRFRSRNRFGSAMAVSMDGAPLRRSKRILVQYGTQSRPTGWREVPSTITLEGHPPVHGMEVASYGGAPWQVAKADMDVFLKNPLIRLAEVLDMNGMPIGTVPLQRVDGGVEFSFPASAMYVVLH